MSRYELTDFEWRAIQPHLPNKVRGAPRVDDRRVMNDIFWVLARALAGPTCRPLRSADDHLQPLQSVEGWRVGPPDGCHHQGP